jgi:hypothetical protein
MPSAARLQRLARKLGKGKADDPWHGHLGVRTWKPANHKGYGPLLDAPVEVCAQCRRPWAELKESNFLPKCPKAGSICIRWSAYDMEGNLLEGEDVWLDVDPDDVVKLDWDEFSPEAAARDVQLKWSEEVYEGTPVDEDQASDAVDGIAPDESADTDELQSGSQASGEEERSPLQRCSDETEPTDVGSGVSNETEGARPSDERVTPEPPGLNDDERAYWKRLRRDYDI